MTGAGDPPAAGRRRLPWGRVVISVVVLGAAAAIAIGLANRGTPAAIAPVVPADERRAAPDVALPVLQAGAGIGPEGSRVSMRDLRGRVVVVNFWAWWCHPCREEVPVLQDASEEYDPADVLFLGINSEDVEADARRFLREHPFGYPSLRDPSPEAARAFRIHGYPATLILDRRGRVASSYAGAVEDVAQLTDPVDRILAEG